MITSIAVSGSHIRMISLISAAFAEAENSLPIPIGETLNGLHGKKYLVVSNGENNAIPSPPSVNMSSTPWEAVIRKKNDQIKHHLFEKMPILRNAKIATTVLSIKAKHSEWKKPRCPKNAPYSIPRLKLITSVSAKTEQKIPRIQNRKSIFSSVTVLPTTTGIKACVITEGNFHFPLQIFLFTSYKERRGRDSGLRPRTQICFADFHRGAAPLASLRSCHPDDLGELLPQTPSGSNPLPSRHT